MLQSRRRRRYGQQVPAPSAPPPWRKRLILVAVVAFLFSGIVVLMRSLPLGGGERVATVLQTEGRGRVEVQISGEEISQGAETGLKLYEGDRVSTDDDSSAVLRFFDGSVVALDNGSEVLLTDVLRGEETSIVSFEIEEGRVFIGTGTGTAVRRTVVTRAGKYRVPPRTRAIIGETLHVFSDSGPGIASVIRLSGRADAEVIVGEGQELDLRPERIAWLTETGGDPYELRNVLDEGVLSSTFFLRNLRRGEQPVEVAMEPEEETFGGELLVIDAPEDGILLQGSTVLVKGHVNPRVANVRVNGYGAELSEGAFEKEIALPAEEEFTVEVHAEDRDGIVVATKTLSLSHDVMPPEPPNITSPMPIAGAPEEGGETAGGIVPVTEDVFEIVGDASPDTMGIIVNGYQLQKFRSGQSWRYLVDPKLGNVRIGENAYDVVAVDRAGNRSDPVSITIVWKAQLPPVLAEAGSPRDEGSSRKPGSLRVVAPSDGSRFETGANEVLIEGETSPETAAISINGFTLTKYIPGKTAWNYIAKEEFGNYRPGVNRYTIVARNAKGEILDVMQYVIEWERR